MCRAGWRGDGGAAPCSVCAAGTYSWQRGSSECAACSNGTDSRAGESKCRPCRAWDTHMVDRAVNALRRGDGFGTEDGGPLEAILAHYIREREAIRAHDARGQDARAAIPASCVELWSQALQAVATARASGRRALLRVPGAPEQPPCI